MAIKLNDILHLTGEQIENSRIELNMTAGRYGEAFWERGTNENTNKLIRRFVPKGADIGEFSHERIKIIEHWINNYPRKIFNGKSSNELLKTEEVA